MLKPKTKNYKSRRRVGTPTGASELKTKLVIGIDEVGRGPLAGPVVVAAVVIPKGLRFKKKDLRTPLKDSKKLSVNQREAWFKYAKNHQGIFYAISGVSPRVIDRINISKAANLAASRALVRLIANYKLQITNCKIFLDGSLYLNKNISVNQRPHQRLSASTITKGDEKITAIMLASIVAKVSRDRKMKKLHFEYPQYDFINNVGYGTKKHRRAIRKHGLSPIHRRSFKLK